MRILDAVPSTRQVNGGLLVLRLVLGTIFMAHGAQKIFVFGMSAIAGGFGEMGIPLAGVMGPLVSLAELFGGAALVLGLATRVAGVGLAVTMLGAIVFAHLGAGFFAPAGYEFPLMLLAASAALVVTGAGGWSVDAVLDRRLRPLEAASGSAAVSRSAHVRAA